MEHIEYHGKNELRQNRIVTVAFIAKKSVLTIELMPREVNIGCCHRVVNCTPTIERDVRILSAPNHHHLRSKLRHSIQCIVVEATTQTALVDVRRVKTNARLYVWIHCGTERQVAAKADSQRRNASIAEWQLPDMVDHRNRIGIIASKFLGRL